jgi:hypothetical protein
MQQSTRDSGGPLQKKGFTYSGAREYQLDCLQLLFINNLTLVPETLKQLKLQG